VSDTLSENRVTCPSCEYRYPRSQEICVMCGTPAPALETLRESAAMPDEFTPTYMEAACASNRQLRPGRAGLMRLVPIVGAFIPLLVFASFWYQMRKDKPHTAPGAATQVTSTVEPPKADKINPQPVVAYSDRQAPLTIPASLITVQTKNVEKQNDPAFLWNAVKRGNVRSEVALANLYIKGEEVPQNCEQAHMLILAASKKDSRLAKDSLRNYTEHCK
jgi:hypothetical protein